MMDQRLKRDYLLSTTLLTFTNESFGQCPSARYTFTKPFENDDRTVCGSNKTNKAGRNRARIEVDDACMFLNRTHCLSISPLTADPGNFWLILRDFSALVVSELLCYLHVRYCYTINKNVSCFKVFASLISLKILNARLLIRTYVWHRYRSSI